MNSYDTTQITRAHEFLRKLDIKDGPGLSDKIALEYALKLIKNDIGRSDDAFFKSYGITRNQFEVLVALMRAESEGNEEGLQPSEISADIVMPRNTVSNTLAALEKHGYIIRRNSPDDLRIFKISLSESGRSFMEANTPAFITHISKSIDELTDEQLETLLSLVTSVCKTRNLV